MSKTIIQTFTFEPLAAANVEELWLITKERSAEELRVAVECVC